MSRRFMPFVPEHGGKPRKTLRFAPQAEKSKVSYCPRVL